MTFHIKKEILNFKSIPVFTQYEMIKAKKNFVLNFSECAICGSTKDLECHHIHPIHLYPDLALDNKNFITLCDSSNNGCHRWFGHMGNFCTLYNPHIREYAMCNRLFIEFLLPDRKFIVSTKRLEDFFAYSIDMKPSLFRLKYMEQVKNLFRMPVN
jgi:hypothetical protein